MSQFAGGVRLPGGLARVVLVFWLIIAAFADIIANDRVSWSPTTVDREVTPYSPPGAHHWLGTDHARRDVLARVVHGARTTLGIGVSAALLMVTIGTLLGLVAGYSGHIVDIVITRLSDAVLALPMFFLALAIIGTIERSGPVTVVLILGACAWPSIARVIRLEARSLRDAEFVIAARMMGGSRWYIVRHHILPHLRGLVIVSFVFAFATAAMVESSLSFLGVGVPDATPTWGGLMRGATQHLSAWWLIVVPGLALTSVVIAAMSVADRHDALDTATKIDFATAARYRGR